MNYYEILSFSNFYFEDSYVLSIDEVAGLLVFELDAVLTKSHPQYEEPKTESRIAIARFCRGFLTQTLSNGLIENS